MEKTFGSMMEELKSPYNQNLNVTPPLHLKELGQCVARLVLLSEGTKPQYDWVISQSYSTYTVCFMTCVLHDHCKGCASMR